MSLLMQALKKAERAKQNAAGEDETDRPSEAFDDMLAMTPEPAGHATDRATDLAAGQAARPALSFDLEPLSPQPISELSLTPLAADVAPASPAQTPISAAALNMESGLTLDFAPDTTAAAAAELNLAPLSASSPAAGPSRTPATPPAPAPTYTATHAATAATPTPTSTASQRTGAARTNAGGAGAHPGGRTGHAEQAGKSSGKAAEKSNDKAADKAANKAAAPRGAARAAAAATADEPSGIDPARLRLIGLCGAVLLILLIFGYVYWQAMVAPGAGSRLPPVPMPPPGATGATPVQTVVAATGAAPDAPAADSQLAPALPSASKRNDDDLERRLAHAEQELAATQQTMQAQLSALSAPRPDKLPPLAAKDNGEIRVARASQQPTLTPALDSGYQALAAGDLPRAQQQYEAALGQDPNNRDTLLGLATLAARQNQGPQASAYYVRLLELDPNDSTALAGLIGLRQGDPGQSEIKLKGILAANPEAAPVLFALGNLTARQGRWSEAQQYYFRAYSAAPDNPDYAYNLAVGLDRLNQGKLALGYYQRALAMSQGRAAAFDPAALRKRVAELTAATAATAAAAAH